MFVSIKFLRGLQDMSSRHLQDMSSRHVCKTSSRRLQRTNFSSSKTSSRRLARGFQYVFKMSLQDVFKASSRRLQNVFARRLQDVLEDLKLLHWKRVKDVFKTNKYLLGLDEHFQETFSFDEKASFWQVYEDDSLMKIFTKFFHLMTRLSFKYILNIRSNYFWSSEW